MSQIEIVATRTRMCGLQATTSLDTTRQMQRGFRKHHFERESNKGLTTGENR